MNEFHSGLGFKGVVMALVLEFLFLSICLVLVNHGLHELRKRKSRARNGGLIALGAMLAVVSVYATVLLIEG